MKKGKMNRLLKKACFALFFFLLSSTSVFLIETASPPVLPLEGTPAYFYANQCLDDLQAVYLSGINEAKKSIVLIIYSLTDKQIIQALKDKSEQGVSVNVICDAKCCPNVATQLGQKVSLQRRICPGIMHQKLLVVDDQKTWIGSANLTTESLKIHGNLVHVIHSPEFSAAVLEKASAMSVNEKVSKDPHIFTIGGQRIELWFIPDHRKGVERLIEVIRSAKKSIRVAMFTWTRFDLAKEIIEAKKKGIQVEIALDGQSSKGASKKIANLFKKYAVPMRCSKGSALLHYKFLYVDDEILVNGSANWTKGAFTKNEDCFMILHHLDETQKVFMEKLWNAIVADTKQAYKIQL